MRRAQSGNEGIRRSLVQEGTCVRAHNGAGDIGEVVGIQTRRSEGWMGWTHRQWSPRLRARRELDGSGAREEELRDLRGDGAGGLGVEEEDLEVFAETHTQVCV